jgi:hypothetical protein
MKNMNRTQILGLAIVGLSLFTYIGGAAGLVGSWLAAVEPSGVHIYVRDASTNQHLSADAVVVQITGFSYIGVDYPLSVVLRPSSGTPCYWGFSSSLYTIYYVSVSADGYVTQPGTVSMPQNFIKDYTWRLSPTPEPAEEPAEDPVEDPVVEEPLVEDPVEEPETNTNMNNEVVTSLRDTLQTYSLFTGLIGAGVFTLGTVKEEKRR